MKEKVPRFGKKMGEGSAFFQALEKVSSKK
jgi:hypothetical protein